MHTQADLLQLLNSSAVSDLAPLVPFHIRDFSVPLRVTGEDMLLRYPELIRRIEQRMRDLDHQVNQANAKTRCFAIDGAKSREGIIAVTIPSSGNKGLTAVVPDGENIYVAQRAAGYLTHVPRQEYQILTGADFVAVVYDRLSDHMPPDQLDAALVSAFRNW
jgi:hypothetical protein